MKKKLLSLLLVIAAICSMTVTAFAATPIIDEVEYEGRGIVEVEFKKNVQYKNLKVKVTDAAGVTQTAVVVEKDKDELSFLVPDARPGKYTFRISGIRSGKSGAYETVTGEFKIPDWDPLFKDIEYDRSDKELELEFAKKVQYKNVKVVVTDENGKTYRCTIEEKSNREMELKVSGLKKGQKYTVTVTGIRPADAPAYGTIVGVFKVK